MSALIRISGGLSLLLLFLFPQVQKGLHDFHHRHDFHCDATAEVHLHSLEHVCDICDLAVAVGIETSFGDHDIFLDEILISFSDKIARPFSPDYWQLLPPRAPPVSQYPVV